MDVLATALWYRYIFGDSFGTGVWLATDVNGRLKETFTFSAASCIYQYTKPDGSVIQSISLMFAARG